MKVIFLVKKFTIKFVLDPPPPSGGCFPSIAKVVTKNGKSVTMSELQKGDRVQTGIHQQVLTIHFLSAQ